MTALNPDIETMLPKLTTDELYCLLGKLVMYQESFIVQSNPIAKYRNNDAVEHVKAEITKRVVKEVAE